VVIGYVTGQRAEIDLPAWLLDDVALLPVNMIRQERRAQEVAGQLIERVSAGELQVAFERFGLADTAQALEALRSGRIRGRAVVVPD
jgi:NADPH:quinone reductase